jgi:hypothetical protein
MICCVLYFYVNSDLDCYHILRISLHIGEQHILFISKLKQLYTRTIQEHTKTSPSSTFSNIFRSIFQPASPYFHPSNPISSQRSGLSAIEIQKSARCKQNDQITADESGQDAEVPPAMIEGEAERLIELITNFVRTVLTRTCDVIPQISRPAPRKEIGHVVATSLTLRSRKAIELMWCTLNHPPMQLCRHHAADQSREWDEFVQPDAPKFRDLGFGNGDAAEEGEDDYDERVE